MNFCILSKDFIDRIRRRAKMSRYISPHENCLSYKIPRKHYITSCHLPKFNIKFFTAFSLKNDKRGNDIASRGDQHFRNYKIKVGMSRGIRRILSGCLKERCIFSVSQIKLQSTLFFFTTLLNRGTKNRPNTKCYICLNRMQQKHITQC